MNSAVEIINLPTDRSFFYRFFHPLTKEWSLKITTVINFSFELGLTLSQQNEYIKLLFGELNKIMFKQTSRSIGVKLNDELISKVKKAIVTYLSALSNINGSSFGFQFNVAYSPNGDDSILTPIKNISAFDIDVREVNIFSEEESLLHGASLVETAPADNMNPLLLESNFTDVGSVYKGNLNYLSQEED